MSFERIRKEYAKNAEMFEGITYDNDDTRMSWE